LKIIEIPQGCDNLMLVYFRAFHDVYLALRPT
jgi:hypothetical protein